MDHFSDEQWPIENIPLVLQVLPVIHSALSPYRYPMFMYNRSRFDAPITAIIATMRARLCGLKSKKRHLR